MTSVQLEDFIRSNGLFNHPRSCYLRITKLTRTQMQVQPQLSQTQTKILTPQGFSYFPECSRLQESTVFMKIMGPVSVQFP